MYFFIHIILLLLINECWSSYNKYICLSTSTITLNKKKKSYSYNKNKSEDYIYNYIYYAYPSIINLINILNDLIF